jgi:hypothetical protein
MTPGGLNWFVSGVPFLGLLHCILLPGLPNPSVLLLLRLGRGVAVILIAVVLLRGPWRIHLLLLLSSPSFLGLLCGVGINRRSIPLIPTLSLSLQWSLSFSFLLTRRERSKITSTFRFTHFAFQ